MNNVAYVSARKRTIIYGSCFTMSSYVSGRRLRELPEILRQPLHCGRRIEDDFRTVQAEQSSTLGEVPVVTDVHADRRVARLEDRIAEVARFEEELFPES